LVKALFWTLASRLSIQFFSFLRVVILARILTPYDFGISASTFIAYQLLEMLTFTGFTTALTAYKGEFREGYPTLFWTSLLRGIILFFLLFLFSDSIGAFFKDSNVSFAIKVVAISFIPSSITNPIFIVEANRFFRFEKIFILEFSEALINTVFAIFLGLYFRDFRAMIYSFLIGAFAKMFISYILRPYIPSLSFSFLWLKRMLSFGIWVNLTFVLNFLLRYADRTLVGKFSGQHSLGIYSNAQNLAFLVAPQLSSMISRVLFPYFVVSDVGETEKAFLSYMRASLFVGLLFFAPMFFWSDGVIRIALGEKWMDAVEILKPLSIASILSIISNTISPLSQGKGKPNLDVYRLAVIPLVFLLLSLLNPRNPIWVSWCLSFGYLASIPVWYLGISSLGIRPSRIFLSLIPLISSAFLPFLFPEGILRVLVSIFSYTLTEILLFRGMGIFEVFRLKIPNPKLP
jgi:lipopolysaccharide exporter